MLPPTLQHPGVRDKQRGFTSHSSDEPIVMKVNPLGMFLSQIRVANEIAVSGGAKNLKS